MEYTVKQLRKLVAAIQRPDKKSGQIFYNKYKFKNKLQLSGIRVPKTYAYITNKSQAVNIQYLDSFVMKPNVASGGIDVYSLTKTADGKYEEISGRIHEWSFIEGKIDNILMIQKGGGVLIEELISNPPEFNTYLNNVQGIVDFRMYMLDNEIMFSKARIPNKLSEGYSNTGRKGSALFVSKDGIIKEDILFNNTTTIHPDSKREFKNATIPYWDELAKVSCEIAKLFNVRFHSVDITLDTDHKACCIESELIPLLSHFTKQGCKVVMSKIQAAMEKDLSDKVT